MLLLETSNTWPIGYASITMTLSGLQGHSSTASVFNCNFSYMFAAVDNISTDTESRAVPLRRLSLFFTQKLFTVTQHYVSK